MIQRSDSGAGVGRPSAMDVQYDCRHITCFHRDGRSTCARCGYSYRLTTMDDWPIEKLAEILPAEYVAGLALGRALRSVAAL